MFRKISLLSLLALALLITACASTSTTASPSAPTTIPSLGSSPTRSQTPSLSFSFVTPTLEPTNTRVPTPTPFLVNGTPVVLPTSSSPNAIGNTAADAQLVNILEACWGVNDTRALNAQIAPQVAAFDCARGQLTQLASNYPAYPEVHRLLAWGYYYKDNDPGRAIEEYRTSANLYKAANDSVGESEARMRLGLLLVVSNKSEGCGEFALAINLNQQNARATQYYSAFQCNQSNQTSGGTPVAPVVLGPVDLGAVRGKIVFKSDRDGFEKFYVVGPDGKNVKQINDPRLYQAASQWESFSPDHQQVAIVRLEGYDRQLNGDNNDIWVTDPSGGSGRALANPHNDYDPVWSPQGLFDGRQWLAFVSNRGDVSHPNAKGPNLWLMQPDGTDPRRLSCNPDYRYAKHPSFSPDATKLVYSSDLLGKAQLFIADLNLLGSATDTCKIGDAAVPITASNNGRVGDYEPVWVK